VAAAVGKAIVQAFGHKGIPAQHQPVEHDPIYKALRDTEGFLTATQLGKASGVVDAPELERRISLLSRDFDIEIEDGSNGPLYRMGGFKAFVGQADHTRHQQFEKHRSRIS
jgi:DNA (cytosine-5)-methyltransferase 1